jgi:hypothetical protein
MAYGLVEMKRMACVLGLLGLAASCRTQDNTLIVVEVGSELAVPSQLDAVRIEVTGPTANSSKIYPLGSSRELPIHLALVPDAANDASLTVKATGMQDHVEIVWQAVRVAFVPGESKLLRLNLTRLCSYVTCRPTESCEAGRCTTVPTIPEIPDYVPESSASATGGAGGITSGVSWTGGSPSVPGLGGVSPIGGGGSGGLSSVAGRSSSGGTSGTGGVFTIGGTCAVARPCGGDVTGTWNVTSSCLKYSGYADVSYLGLTCVPNVANITGSLIVSGTLTLGSNARYTEATLTTGTETWQLDKSCLILSGTKVRCDTIGEVFAGEMGTFGYTTFKCADDAATGGCSCSAVINREGGMGILYDDVQTKGTYKMTPDGTLMMGDTLTYSYCVNGASMTATPIPVSFSGTPYQGEIVLQRNGGGVGGAGGTGGTGGVSSSGSTSACGPLPQAPAFDVAPLPCEVIAKDGGGAKCVTAHSTVRVIVPGYAGPLYQLCKGSSKPGPGSCQGTPLDIQAKDGIADVDAHDAFCASEDCTITKIYDQSGKGNDLEPAPRGGAKSTPGNPAKAKALPVVINGRKAYGLLLKAGMGYRAGCNGCTVKQGNGMAMGDASQTIYMVTSQKDLIDGCCFDYGNAETTCNDDGNGFIEAVYFGGGVVWGSGYGGKPGPWVMADLENGLYAGWQNKQDKNISTNMPLKFDFVTAVLVGDTAEKNNGKGRFALYGADAQGKDATFGKLACLYDGIRPEKPGYLPMQKQGSLVLNVSGDNSNGGGGRFYEGATIVGPLVSKTTLSFLHAVVVAAKYAN